MSHHSLKWCTSMRQTPVNLYPWHLGRLCWVILIRPWQSTSAKAHNLLWPRWLSQDWHGRVTNPHWYSRGLLIRGRRWGWGVKGWGTDITIVSTPQIIYPFGLYSLSLTLEITFHETISWNVLGIKFVCISAVRELSLKTNPKNWKVDLSSLLFINLTAVASRGAFHYWVFTYSKGNFTLSFL